MKMSSASILIFIHLFEACAELVFRQLAESQSLELSCSPQQERGSLTGLHLYHRSARSQTTLLSMAKGGELRVAPGHRGRLQLCGGLDSPRVNVTISHLRPGDTGLYMWELSYGGDGSSGQMLLSAQKLFLLVEGAGRSCRYSTVLLTICTAAGLLLLTLSCLAIEKCMKARHRHRSQPPVPIYEEMTRKQQSVSGSPRNNHQSPSHLEEVAFPVYANPNIRQPQDNYYAVPGSSPRRA